MTPALQYAAITREVTEMVSRHSGNDRERACYLIARAALLTISADKGCNAAASKAYALADELCAGVAHG